MAKDLISWMLLQILYRNGHHRTLLLLIGVCMLVSCDPSTGRKVRFHDGNVVVLTGGTNISDTRKNGYLETMLLAAHKKKKLYFRNMGWEGDTVYEQYREGGFGDWSGHLDSVQADIVFAQFGQMESLDGEAAIPGFIESYKKLLAAARGNNRQIVLLSPIPFEPASLLLPAAQSASVPIVTAPVDKYVAAIRQLAADEGYVFVNLYEHFINPDASYTRNGMHLTEEGHKVTAEIIMRALQLPSDYHNQWEPLRKEVLAKNDLWFRYWRAGNWAFIYGGEYVQQFSRHWKDRDHRILPEERNAIGPLLDSAELRVENAKRKL